MHVLLLNWRHRNTLTNYMSTFRKDKEACNNKLSLSLYQAVLSAKTINFIIVSKILNDMTQFLQNRMRDSCSHRYCSLITCCPVISKHRANGKVKFITPNCYLVCRKVCSGWQRNSHCLMEDALHKHL